MCTISPELWNTSASNRCVTDFFNNGTEEENMEAYIHFRNTSRFWVQRILIPLIVCVGVLGNVVSIVVLTRKNMRSSTNIYLTALAVSDLLYLLFLFSLSLKHYPNINEPTSFNYVYWEYFGFGVWFVDATSKF